MNNVKINFASKYLYTALSVVAFIIVAYLYFQELGSINKQVENNLFERATEASNRLSKSVSRTAWEIYQKSQDRRYPDELAAEILDSELNTDFISAITVLGNFGHVLMGRQKLSSGEIESILRPSDQTIRSNKKVRTGISQGNMTIGNIEIYYTNEFHLQRSIDSKIASTIRFFFYSFLLQTSIYLLYRSVSKTQKIALTYDKLNAAQEQLIESEKFASLGALVAGVAHELNTPLGISITSFSLIEDETKKIKEVFEKGEITKQGFEDYLAHILETIDLSNKGLGRAIELVNHFKQTSVDRSIEESRQINVKDYITEVMVTLQFSIKRANSTYTISGDSDVNISTIPGSVAQIVTNIVNNAVLHAFDGNSGHLDIDISTGKHGEAVMSFTDDGKGMSKSVIKKIYEPFFTTKRGMGGTGLGMNIVFNIITKKLKGTIDIKSKEGRGTTLTISLPPKLVAAG